ncbi:MAG: helix-turn-helix domain-containing protein [Alphaproteobacteria bacterium]|jgi:AraC-like DNA-binding protein
MPPIELALKTGTAAIMLLTGLLLLRDRRHLESGPFGGLLALSVAAYAVISVAGARSPWLWPVMLVAMGTPALFWIWAGAIFVDDFRPSWRDALAWMLLPIIGALGIYQWRPWMGTAEDILGLLFVLLTAWRVLAGLHDDLVERRRRLRPVLVILAVLYAGGLLLMNMLGRDHPPDPASRIVEASVLAALAVAFALVGLRAGRHLFSSLPVETGSPGPVAIPEATTAVDAQEDALLAGLRHLMEKEKVYRQEGFGVNVLVAALDVPEYRLRRLINQQLGHRNFSSFVNGYRLAEATAALADPGQADVPILTIALDSGFQSIGPFNRAFKAHTGMTPTAYRKQAESRTDRPI